MEYTSVLYYVCIILGALLFPSVGDSPWKGLGRYLLISTLFQMAGLLAWHSHLNP